MLPSRTPDIYIVPSHLFEAPVLLSAPDVSNQSH